DRDAVHPADLEDAREVARHAELVDDENCARLRRQRRRDALRIDVTGRRFDVDEHRRPAAVADGVGGGDERMADRDDLVAGLDADGEQGEMERGRAVRDRGRERRADGGGELALEGGDLRALRDPAREDDAADGFDLALVELRLGDGNDGSLCSGHLFFRRSLSAFLTGAGALRLRAPLIHARYGETSP